MTVFQLAKRDQKVILGKVDFVNPRFAFIICDEMEKDITSDIEEDLTDELSVDEESDDEKTPVDETEVEVEDSESESNDIPEIDMDDFDELTEI